MFGVLPGDIRKMSPEEYAELAAYAIIKAETEKREMEKAKARGGRGRGRG